MTPVHHTTPMNFSDLVFTNHLLPGAVQSIKTFDNNWQVSVVAGHKDSGLHGIIGDATFEVAIFRPNGNLLEDVLNYQTPSQITTILKVIEML